MVDGSEVVGGAERGLGGAWRGDKSLEQTQGRGGDLERSQRGMKRAKEDGEGCGRARGIAASLRT